MKHVFARPARDSDIEKFVEWCGQNPSFDRRVLEYKTTSTFCAYDSDGVLAFMPMQQPLCMEAMSFRPGITDSQKAIAMKELTHLLIATCHAKGAGEVIFLGSNEHTNAYAVRQGFSELPWKLYRVRLSDLEGIAEEKRCAAI